ncbi:MAG TPA: post-COAP-1 domain-containing protein, partial [Gemmatimonadales bacterium]
MALLALACDPPSPGAERAITSPDFHVGCVAGLRFTGGGRVDVPDVGKVTFGFNVDGRDLCGTGGAVRGQVQVVEHANQVVMHSTSIDHFSSFPSSSGGQCGEWDGTIRLKEVQAGGDWTDHHFFMQVCDNGEPGHGVDTFSVSIEDP